MNDDIGLNFTCTGSHRNKRGVAIGAFHFGNKKLGGQDFVENYISTNRTLDTVQGVQHADTLTGWRTRKGVRRVFKIDNPARIELTFSDDIHQPSYGISTKRMKRSGFSAGGDVEFTNYQLAMIHAQGYDRVPSRDLFAGMEQYAERPNFKRMLTMTIRKARQAKRYVKGDGGIEYRVRVQWDTIRDKAVNVMQQAIARNAFGLAPLKPITRKERIDAGLPPDPPMYATGELAKSIVGEVVYGGNDAIPFEDEIPF